MAWHNRTILSLVSVLGVVGICSPLLGADDLKISEVDVSKPVAAATVEKICERAVANIAIRYNLNDQQTEYTSRLMKKGVSEFLKEHEEEIWPVIRELLSRKLQPPESVEDLKRMGKVTRKLARQAREAIFEANAEWRKVLTDDQKSMHDYDLAEMEKTFGQIDDNFSAWEKGDRPDRPIFGDPVPANAGPARPTRPPDGLLPSTGEKRDFSPTIFDTLVEEFIKDYALDASQVEAARSILKEIKAQAADYQNAKKAELAAIEERRKQAMADADLEAIKKINEENKKLLEPIFQLFARLEARLKNLLTTEQLERYAKSQESAEPAKPGTTTKETTTKKEMAPTKGSPKKTASATNTPSEAKTADVDKNSTTKKSRD